MTTSSPPTADPRDSVRFHLHSLLAHKEAGRYEPDFVHASELTREDPEFCPREWALYDLTGKRPREELVTTAQQATYSMGHMIQARVTHWLTLCGLAVGDWRCADCGELHVMIGRPDECTLCGCGELAYEEMRFKSRKSGTSCGVDVLVRLPTRKKLLIVEVKSMMKEGFKALKMPLAEHRTRTCFYLQITDESDDPATREVDTTEARIIYVAKGGWGVRDTIPATWNLEDGPWSPFKEYVVHRGDADVEHYSTRASMVKEFRDGGDVPLGLCPTQFCKRAKGCSVVNDCFGGQHPAGPRA